MPQARLINMKNKNIDHTEVKLDKFDNWIGIKMDEDYTNADLANARFKAAYLMLYTLIGLSFVLSAVLIYMTKVTNELAIGLMLGTVIYGLFTFIFHQNKDALMLGVLALTIAAEKIFTIITTHKIGGLSIVIIGFLVMIAITVFKANDEIDINSNKVLKLIARILFVILIMLAIVGLTLD